jgi:hypothetical protein
MAITQEEQPPHLAMITTQNLMKINIRPITIGHGKWIYQQLKYTMDVLQRGHKSLKMDNKYWNIFLTFL